MKRVTIALFGILLGAVALLAWLFYYAAHMYDDPRPVIRRYQ